MNKKYFFTALTVASFVYLYSQNKLPDNGKFELKIIPKSTLAKNSFKQIKSEPKIKAQEVINTADTKAIEKVNKKNLQFKETNDRKTASTSKVPKYIYELNVEKIIIQNAEIFEQIDWRMSKDSIDNYQRKIKKMNLSNGDIAIKYHNESSAGRHEIIINEKEEESFSRSIFSDEGIVSYTLNNKNGDEQALSYKDGILHSSILYYQNYRYSIEYDSSRQITNCNRQKIVRKNNLILFGNEENCNY